MDSIQRLRQQAYASGALQSNQYQSVDVQSQGTSQVVAIQPANPQVIYVPQYNPQVVYAQPDTSAVVAASLFRARVGVTSGPIAPPLQPPPAQDALPVEQEERDALAT